MSRLSLEQLKHEVLHKETIKASKNEKLATLTLLDHLWEVKRRNLYGRRGHSSLNKYLVKELGYTSNEAQVRIAAMRLIDKAPEIVRPAILSGELAFTNAALIDSNLGKDKIPPEDVKKKIKDSIGMSTRELLQEIRPSEARNIFLPGELVREMNRLGWTDMNEIQMIQALVEEKTLRIKLEKSDKETVVDLDKSTRYLPVRVKEFVLRRSGHQCEYPGCTARYGLEFHHEEAFAKGGDRSASNIKHYCRAHNQLEAINEFGIFDKELYGRT